MKCLVISDGAELLRVPVGRLRITDSRNTVKGRSALVDGKGNEQGYCRLVVEGDKAEILFLHRSAQNFSGTMTLDAVVECPADAFSCRAIPEKDERVLNLSCGPAFSSSDDSLFSPEADLLLQMTSSRTRLSAGGKTGDW